MPWQDILGGLFGGLAGGMENIQQNRQRNSQIQLQQLQLKQQQKQQEFEELRKQYETLTPDADIDPTMAQRFVSGGLSVVKGPTGGMRRPASMNEQADAARLKTANIDMELKQEELTMSQKSRAFRESLQAEGGMQAFMNRPKQQRDAMWAANNMGGHAPMSVEEMAQEDIAKSQGDLGVERVRQQGYLDAANVRTNASAAGQESYPQFQAYMDRLYSQDPNFRAKFEQAKKAGDLQNFLRIVMNDYKQMGFK